MKTLGTTIFLSACAAALLAAPLRAEKSAAPAPAPTQQSGVSGFSPTPGTGPGLAPGLGVGPDAGVRRDGINDSTWGRRGPDPEIAAKAAVVADLERKAADQGAKLRAAAPAAQAAAKAELRKTLGELFDAKLAAGEALAQSMEKRAAALKARLEKRKAGREALIDKRVEQLAGDEDDDWF